MGGVPGVKIRRHFADFQRADIRRQVGVERLHHLLCGDFSVIGKAQGKAAGVYPRVGAGAALDIGAAAQHRLHGILQHLADGQRVGLHLKARIIRALVGDPE